MGSCKNYKDEISKNEISKNETVKPEFIDIGKINLVDDIIPKTLMFLMAMFPILKYYFSIVESKIVN